MTENEQWVIGKVSTMTGCHIETIRYYEKIELLCRADRSKGGHRLYESRHVEQLNFIMRARELGINHRDIRVLLTLSADSTNDCAAAQAIADNHLEDIRAKITDLRKLENVLSNLSAKCLKAPDSGCPILKSLNTIR